MVANERPCILLIEDEPAIADTVVYALQTEGFEPLWRMTGHEGLVAFAEHQPDLIILDIGLPDANGFDLCRQIRRIRPVPVIFLTARATEIDRVVGLEIGADDYVVKPFSPRELTARVKAVLRRTQGSESEPPLAESSPLPGPFAVDEEGCQIRYNGQPLTLSRYEYRLLVALLKRPGRIYSRETLLQLVWDNPDHSLDRTVDTHIKTLRAKLRAVNPDANPIKTHRGLGYSLSFETP